MAAIDEAEEAGLLPGFEPYEIKLFAQANKMSIEDARELIDKHGEAWKIVSRLRALAI